MYNEKYFENKFSIKIKSFNPVKIKELTACTEYSLTIIEKLTKLDDVSVV